MHLVRAFVQEAEEDTVHSMTERIAADPETTAGRAGVFGAAGAASGAANEDLPPDREYPCRHARL